MSTTSSFDFSFKWIGSATWIMTIDGIKLACDPVLCPKDTIQNYGLGLSSKRMTSPVYDESDFKDVAIWLITHEHQDHLDAAGLSKINPESIIITNNKAQQLLRTIKPHKLQSIKPGDKVTHTIQNLTVEITATPVVHGSNPLIAALAGGGNGYRITVRKASARMEVYITGDTVFYKKLIKNSAARKTDILIPHIGAPFNDNFGGPLTFTIPAIQPLVEALKPEIILPVHFNSFSHFKEKAADVTEWKKRDDRVKIVAEGDKFSLN